MLNEKILDEAYNLFSLLEADDVGTNDAEPMEQDSTVGDNGGADTGTPSQGEDGGGDDMSGMDDGMEGDDAGDGMDDPSGADGSDPSTMGTENQGPSEIDKVEIAKKVKLLKDYEDLIEVNDNLIKSSSLVSTSLMTDKEKNLYAFCCRKIKENYDKMITIVNDKYENMSYENLLTLFFYCKVCCLNFTEMIDKILNRSKEINPELVLKQKRKKSKREALKQ